MTDRFFEFYHSVKSLSEVPRDSSNSQFANVTPMNKAVPALEWGDCTVTPAQAGGPQGNAARNDILRINTQLA